MSKQKEQFEEILKSFPDAARVCLRAIPENGGKLPFDQCHRLLTLLEIELEDLMVRLLPIAKLYAIVPVSNFRVGAIAGVQVQDEDAAYELFLGANIEFAGLALNQTVHAEQAAIINAWHHGTGWLRSVAVSAAPCGYCRQFLLELEKSDRITIITAANDSKGFSTRHLMELLPDAFGQDDLIKTADLVTSYETRQHLTLPSTLNDPLVLEAFSAAETCHAPYTKNYAGCAVQVNNGRIYSGRYAENVAFNPSLSPLQSAIVCMNMGFLAGEPMITRAVLVEKPSRCGQRNMTELILKSCAPTVTLEYFEAV